MEYYHERNDKTSESCCYKNGDNLSSGCMGAKANR